MECLIYIAVIIGFIIFMILFVKGIALLLMWGDGCFANKFRIVHRQRYGDTWHIQHKTIFGWMEGEYSTYWSLQDAEAELERMKKPKEVIVKTLNTE